MKIPSAYKYSYFLPNHFFFSCDIFLAAYMCCRPEFEAVRSLCRVCACLAVLEVSLPSFLNLTLLVFPFMFFIFLVVRHMEYNGRSSVLTQNGGQRSLSPFSR